MALKTWTLTDVDAGVYIDELELKEADLPAAARGCTIRKRRLRGGLVDGVDLIEIKNGDFWFAIVPTRGMGIWRARLRDIDVGWKSPVRGPVHPQFVPYTEPSGLGWLEGFDELLVRCGLESNGAPEFDEEGHVKYALHGRIANKPAHRVSLSVDSQTGEISVAGEVDETRFHFHKLRLKTICKTSPGEPGLRIHDEMENLSGEATDAQMLYHWNFGNPLLDSGARVVAPLKTVVPRNAWAAEGVGMWDSYPAEQAGYEEQVYFLEPTADSQGDTMVMLKNAHGTLGMSLHYNIRQLPCFTVWKNTVAVEDGYVTGLEPATNYPNPRSFETEQNRVVRLPVGGSHAMRVRLQVHGSSDAVAEAERAVAKIQRDVSTRVFDSPQPGWSPK